MDLLKRWFAFYVFGNIHVAVAAYSLTKITFIQFNIQDQPLANFVFLSTVLSYNFIRLFQIDRINSMMAIWFRSNNKVLIILNAIAMIGCVYYALNLTLKEILVLVPFLAATLFYVFPFKKRLTGLRNVPGLKLFLISATWTGVTLVFPLFVSGIQQTEIVYFHVLQRFLFVFAITIPFDIRDAQFDLEELSTLPQTLGIGASKLIAIAALILYIILDLVLNSGLGNYFLIDLFIIAIAILMIGFSGMKRQRYYTAFWIESLPILWYLLYLFVVD